MDICRDDKEAGGGEWVVCSGAVFYGGIERASE